MKFGIADLLWTTTAVAVLFTLISRDVFSFHYAFLALNLLQVVILIGTLLALILFAEQRDTMLDFATLPGNRILKKIWIISFACTVLLWVLLFSYRGL